MARPHHNPGAALAKVAAEERASIARRAEALAEIQRRTVRAKSYAVAMVITALCALSLHLYQRPMPLPPPHVPVVAWTGSHWYKAYADTNGEFHHHETGLPLGQVTKWERP